MVIIVDSHEENNMVIQQLRNMKVPIQEKWLDVGDFIIGDYCFERKDISDYVASLMDGRLSHQLYNQSYNYKTSYVIVEGFITPTLMFRPNMTREMYYSSLIGCSIKRCPEGIQGQIITINVETPFDTALILKAAHDKIMSGDEFRQPHYGKKAKNTNEAMVLLLTAIPKVGEKKAIAILKKHNTLSSIISLTPKQLQEVEGIGPEIAKNIHETLNGIYKDRKQEIKA